MEHGVSYSLLPTPWRSKEQGAGSKERVTPCSLLPTPYSLLAVVPCPCRCPSALRKGVVWLVAWLLAAAGCAAPTPSLPERADPDQPTLKVAVLTPMTGELATFGEVVRNAAGLAFDDWNERGGVHGWRLQAVLEDTPCDADKARQVAGRVIAGGVRFIVGGVCSEAAIPIARLADDNGVLFIATHATHPLVTAGATGAVRRMAFRVAFAYPYQARAVARFLTESIKIRRVAVLSNPADPYVRSLAGEFGAAFTATGGEVVTVTYSSVGADFGPLVAEAARSGAPALYVPGGPEVANRVGSALRTQKLDLIIIGSDLWTRRELDLAALEGAYFVAHYSRGGTDPLALAWADRYQSAFAVEPDTLAALGYDAVHVLATAIQEAGGVSPPDVARALERMSYTGVSGRWRFDSLHNPLKEAVMLQVKDGDVQWAGLASVR